MTGRRLLLLASLAACSRSPTESSDAGVPISRASGLDAGATATAAAVPGGDAGASAGASSAASWKGTYRSVAGGLYIPADWKGVHYVLKDTTEGLGEGGLTLRVDPASGRVTGTLDGPLGPATIEGAAGAGKLFATIRRTDPADRGFAGTLDGTLTGDRAQGTMNVSQAEVNAIRAATFVLTRDAPGR